MSTSSSSDSDTSSTGLDTDSSMEAEEESYILTEERRQNKARVRRELLGEEGNKRKDPHNNWVIRPRKRSVGLSDVDMESDSDDATEGDEEAEDEEEEGDDEDEDVDGQSSSVAYAGVATGWSEDDESTFDADIFFANLSDIGSDDGSSTNDEAGLQSDTIPDESAAADIISSIQRSMDFEVTEGWDGQIVFTNGLSEGQGMVDIDFETSAAQLVAEDSATVSQDSDVSMHSTDEEDGEYEEGECELGESDGETTEEELVDENGLPTSHAMTLFRWPSSVSAINPLSTVSPTVSPSPHDRRTFGYNSQDLRDSPRPADILAGKVFWDESDEFDHPDGRIGQNSSVTVSRGGAPIMGQFSTESDSPQKTAILTGSNKDIPSPFPRLLRNKGRLRSSSTGSFSSMDFRGRATSRPSSLSISTSSSFPVPSSEEPLSQTSPELPPTEPFDLDDVLDSSYLDSEPSDNHIFSSTASEGESHRHMQNLSRWDRIPMGTFRRTRETTSITGDVGGSSNWSSEPQNANTASDALSYTNMMKSSPLSTMLWHGKGQNAKGSRRKSKAHMNVIISPVLLPIRDGDRTPTLAATDQTLHTNSHNHQQKSRKELRREMKMKRKNCGPVHQHHRHHQQQHHYHHHLPNMKSRSTASMQRTNFFSSPSSVPPLNI
ncbi:hypothetical protein SERLA73DRAFT_191469 [Serpula lacrymans var. lacrymans S7.3]|uniref:Uncharacterized protein n=2 Tax=Serpula lacrymans var. lacrymans TaxID=341189 RepID=F8QHN2_SERL3|nr:uncharacterized protein SERLADRAFT_472433 [Serpula lacrymans var. lacrymans S7.9]EGN92209.1 hypothetical protein SERLA73DRAFT_191469 [Serpula lacrymans var. lacrymans S7.3]EGO22104.1 hypothetical protein SERLADRAFT_472433 [Serpula lacrymans var. lacrymans S7.9]